MRTKSSVPIREANLKEIREKIASAKKLADYKKWQIIYLSTYLEVDMAFIGRVTGCSQKTIKETIQKYRQPLRESTLEFVGKAFGKVNLSERHLQLIRLIAEGKTSFEISSALGISANTIETHRKDIYTKLKIKKVTELVLFAVRQKIIA